MSKVNTDQKLRFGVSALQRNLISREVLIVANSAWVPDLARPLDRIRVDQGAWAPDEPPDSIVLMPGGHPPERPIAFRMGDSGLRFSNGLLMMTPAFRFGEYQEEAGIIMARVLVVEDQKKLLQSLRRGLEEEGYDVAAATNGEEGYYLAT